MLASAIWDYWRGQCMPKPSAYVHTVRTDAGEFVDTVYASADAARAASDNAPRNGNCGVVPLYGAKRERTGDYLRAKARAEFGRTIAGRWFN